METTRHPFWCLWVVCGCIHYAYTRIGWSILCIKRGRDRGHAEQPGERQIQIDVRVSISRVSRRLLGNRDVGSGILPEKRGETWNAYSKDSGGLHGNTTLVYGYIVLSASAGLPQNAPQVHHNPYIAKVHTNIMELVKKNSDQKRTTGIDGSEP